MSTSRGLSTDTPRYHRPWRLRLHSWVHAFGLVGLGGWIGAAEIVWCDQPDRKLSLSIAMPPSVSATATVPVVMWIHGGGWAKGSFNKPSQELRAESLKQGYAFVSIGYRLAPKHVWPAPFLDCRDAVRWIKAHATEYRLDANRIVVSGESAGGHLAALLGLPDMDAVVGDMKGEECRMWAVIAAAGVFTLDAHSTPAADGAIAELLGKPPATAVELARAASPLYHISASAAPMIIIHGGADQIVPPEQAKHMDAALRNAGVPTTLTIVPTAGHPLGSSVRRSDVLIQAFATLRIWRESSLAP